jgi:hypothetical protein
MIFILFGDDFEDNVELLKKKPRLMMVAFANLLQNHFYGLIFDHSIHHSGQHQS